MANPNIVQVGTINGVTNCVTASTSYQTIVQNSAGSGQIFKVNTILVANINGSNPADITVQLVKNGTVFNIAFTISVPADATLVVISKDTSIYLNENDYIRVLGSVNSYLDVIASYDVISQ